MTFCIVDKLRPSELIDVLNFDRTVLWETCPAIKLRALDGPVKHLHGFAGIWHCTQ